MYETSELYETSEIYETSETSETSERYERYETPTNQKRERGGIKVVGIAPE